MKQPLLFEQPKDHASLREVRAAEVERLKSEHGIWTHCVLDDGRNWLAVAVKQCHEALAGYDLTKDELTHPIELYAGYCRLIEEAGLSTDGHSTELAAVKACVELIERFNASDQVR